LRERLKDGALPGREAATEAITVPNQTAGGVLLGTVPYMAPEQARGMPVDQRADVFAFGVVLYEMLGGQRPFRGARTGDTIAAILRDEPPPLPARVPSPLAAVVRRWRATSAISRMSCSCRARSRGPSSARSASQ
jgi:serine/threonine-protein kinase